MFTTFAAQITSPSPPPPPAEAEGGASGAPGAPHPALQTLSQTQTPTPKRRKVARACDACRLNRIKCNDEQPCRNCRERGAKCTNSMPWEAHSLHAARREINRLRDRLSQLQQHQQPPKAVTDGRLEQANHSNASSSNNFTSTYAVPNFADRISNYLARHNLHGLQRAPSLEPAFPLLLEPNSFALAISDTRHLSLSRAKEQHVINLFLQEFHFIFPFLHRDHVQQHFDSLRDDASHNGVRKSSALVDVLLAVAMQYNSALLLRDNPDSRARANDVDACVAGRWLFNRAHCLLLEEQQHPTLQSLQSSMLSTVYLINAGSIKLASSSLATTVRMAHILGVHENSSSAADPTQSDVRRRIWQSLVVLDGSLATSMGLPPIISHLGLIDPSSPEALGKGSDSASAHDDDQIGSAFHLRLLKLVMAVRSVQTLFRCKHQELFQHVADDDDMDAHPSALESLAAAVIRQYNAVGKWPDSVPAALTLSRQDGGRPFSFLGQGALNLPLLAPPWKLRASLALEVIYHRFNLLLLRPFLRLTSGPHGASPTPQADTLAITGLKHAISLVSIVEQVFHERSDALAGWLLVFQCQWEATLYLLGYVLAHRGDEYDPLDARRSIQKAVHTFTYMSRYMSAAQSALGIIQYVLDRSSALPVLNSSDDTTFDQSWSKTHLSNNHHHDDNKYWPLSSSLADGSTCATTALNNVPPDTTTTTTTLSPPSLAWTPDLQLSSASSDFSTTITSTGMLLPDPEPDAEDGEEHGPPFFPAPVMNPHLSVDAPDLDFLLDRRAFDWSAWIPTAQPGPRKL